MRSTSSPFRLSKANDHNMKNAIAKCIAPKKQSLYISELEEEETHSPFKHS